jgi:2-C-methyl-D-erythritol 4-phosphate cytidylyltransferase
VTIAAVITAAGYGTRLGSNLPKGLVAVAGRPLVVHALDRIAPLASVIVVTAPEPRIAEFTHVIHGRADVVAGGDTRQESVWAGLQALAARGIGPTDIVLVHDAARAFMPVGAIREAIAAVEGGADAAIPVVPIVDSIVTAPRPDASYGSVVDRDTLRAVQTPQVFRAAALVAAHEAGKGRGATDDAALVRELGYRVVATDGHQWGFKVTHASDLALATFIAENS